MGNTNLEQLKNIFTELLGQTPSHLAAQHPLEHPASLPQLAESLKSLRIDTAGLVEEQLRRLYAELYEYGPLNALLEDPEVTEIIVIGMNDICFEKHGSLMNHPDDFWHAISFRNILQRILGQAQVQVNVDQPFADGAWRGFRLHVVSPPIAESTQVCLRRHPKNPWTLEQLVGAHWASEPEGQYIQQLVLARKTLLIVGPTGSGKTSILNACLQLVAANERCILLEDTAELQPPNTFSTRLTTRRDSQKILTPIEQNELVKQALRMRPDRIVLGEIRGAEAKDLLLAYSTGHGGGLTTLHADHPRQALLRLEMLVQMGCPEWQLTAIRQLIHLSLSHIIVTARGQGGHRCLQGIYRISSLEESGFTLEQVRINNQVMTQDHLRNCALPNMGT